MVDTQEPAFATPNEEQPPVGEPDGGGTGTAGAKPGIDVQGLVGQLQAMISKVAVASEPRLKEVAAKAAELAAVAAERAGPIAHTLADKTDEVSHTVAEKASAYAASIRAQARGEGEPAEEHVAPDLPDISDPAEESPRDGA